MKHIAIATDWWWGKTITFLEESHAGLVSLQFEDTMPNVGYITELVVRPEERRKGYGYYLISVCEEYAKLKKKKYTQLSVNKEAEWLVTWYKSLGYDIINVDEHEYLMMKKL